MTHPRKLILDGDPGQDDAIAILLALASREVEVLGVCAVAGNAPLARTAPNALAIVELAGQETPVFAGCPRPILAPLQTAEAVHGPTGLDGWTPPPPKRRIEERHAVQFLIDTFRAQPAGSVDICLTGPLTNLAVALIQAPDIAARIGRVVVMGGAYFVGGNSTPAAEWNMLVDPHAAHIVFEAGLDLTLIPLDCTHQCLTTPDRLARIAAIGTPVAAAAAGMLDYYDRYDKAKFGIEGGPLHDPLTVAFLLWPGLFEGKRIRVKVDTASPLCAGQTLFDWWGVWDEPPNALVLHRLDADGFYDRLIGRLARLWNPPE